MKKTLAVMLAFTVLLLTGCAANEAKTQKDGTLSDIYTEMAALGCLPEMVTVDADMALDFYGFEESDYTESVMKLAVNSMLADEVVLLRAKDADAAARMKALLQARMDAKAAEAKDYSPEQYAIIQKGKLLSSGLSLALIVSPEADRLEQVYNAYKTK